LHLYFECIFQVCKVFIFVKSLLSLIREAYIITLLISVEGQVQILCNIHHVDLSTV